MKNDLDYINQTSGESIKKSKNIIIVLCIIIVMLLAIIALQNIKKAPYDERLDELLSDEVEIEKKWLINPKTIPFDLSEAVVFQLEQTYINFSPEMRVRKINDGEQYTFTLKYDMTSDGIKRNEIDIQITKEEYEKLVAKQEGNSIQKMRYQLLVDGELVAIDLFEGDLEGLAYMEIEFLNMEEATAFATPEWVIADVTDDVRYKNGHLARYGIPKLDR
ncbi:hypothetical protein [Cellulosilyticum sp. WCF-2]|uniref:hypothetical protein n=1 Tax=Cellulosilyticum sp. WCF-2 TaxID=2497860 RepID=UPI000F8F3246|nr:hypothetical protein [Cellulosilyticum sp. WCF-2]QEH70193.1 hypothetical protein EKH84_18080 [Cellulosilyticum sp. WCF-2]